MQCFSEFISTLEVIQLDIIKIKINLRVVSSCRKRVLQLSIIIIGRPRIAELTIWFHNFSLKDTGQIMMSLTLAQKSKESETQL